MKLPNSAHTSRPWRIHDLTRDFRVEDVWALPTPGSREDFPRLVRWFVSRDDPARSSGSAARALWAVRAAAGQVFGWDSPAAGLGSRVATLRDRLPPDLRSGPAGPEFRARPFAPLYLLDDEFAAEVANQTMHGVFHLGWVSDGSGGYRGQLAVLVKPNGLPGACYMAAIRPFRHLIVYPGATRDIAQGLAETRRPVGQGRPASGRRPVSRCRTLTAGTDHRRWDPVRIGCFDTLAGQISATLTCQMTAGGSPWRVRAVFRVTPTAE